MVLPLTSIIIVNYNTFGLTVRCIRSIAENCTSDCEIVVVDNASNECDPGEFKKLFPQITLVRSESNSGFAGGINLGLGSARGDYVLLLNSDTEFLNDALGIAVAFLEEAPRVGVATVRLEHESGEAQHNCQRFPSIRHKLFELFRLQKLLPDRGGRVLLGPFFRYRNVVYPDWVWATFFLFRRSILNKMPGRRMNADYFMYGEDMVWCREIRSLGYKIAFVPEGRVQHLMGASKAEKVSLMSESLDGFMKKNYSGVHRAAIRAINFLITGKHAY